MSRPYAKSVHRVMVAMSLISVGLKPDPAAGQDMDRLVAEFTRVWSNQDADALQGILASSVRLDLEGQQYLGVPPRQVSASVGRLFQRLGAAALVVSRSGTLAESHDRGYAEFTWSPSAEDTGTTVRYVIFTSLRRVDGGWHITELRILR